MGVLSQGSLWPGQLGDTPPLPYARGVECLVGVAPVAAPSLAVGCRLLLWMAAHEANVMFEVFDK